MTVANGLGERITYRDIAPCRTTRCCSALIARARDKKRGYVFSHVLVQILGLIFMWPILGNVTSGAFSYGAY